MADSSAMNERIAALMSQLFRVPKDSITDDLAIRVLPVWDSLKHMELVTLIEERFGVELTLDEIVSMQSVREIKRVLRTKAGNA